MAATQTGTSSQIRHSASAADQGNLSQAKLGGKEFDHISEILFASPMKLDSLKSRIKITPLPAERGNEGSGVTPQPKQELQWYFNDYDWRLSVYGLEPATEYVVRILPGMSDLYGNTIQTGQSFTFKTGDMTPYARLVLPWTPLIYRARGPQEVYFEHINLDSVTVSLYEVDFSDFNRMLSGKQDLTYFNPKVEPVREWKPDVDVPRNILNFENFKLQDSKENPLQPGYYFIGVKGMPLDYKSRFYQGFLFIVATDNITLKTTSTEASAWITDLESGKPQADVSVTSTTNTCNRSEPPLRIKMGLPISMGLRNHPTRA
jgi:uncharacterized protein YfaS (alpha-2-macroglobulin family)